ncbi:hypothetical protein N7454_004123 [Penicillium verhagenii]|nr:hypothetical protein N7454_004123 [Penicillium verhagenii]
MQFITVVIATLAAVATATPSPDALEKRTCVGSKIHPNFPHPQNIKIKFRTLILSIDYKVACRSSGPSCCDGWQCVGATEWNAGVCIPRY